MLKIKNFVLANRFYAVVFAIAVIFSSIFATNAYLKNENENACVFSRKTVYFSDAAHSSVIGYSGYLCDGTFMKSGKTSRYTDTLVCDCNEDTE